MADTSRNKAPQASGALIAIRRLLGRQRRDLAWRLEARSGRSWAVRVQPPTGIRGRRALFRSPLAHKLDWSPSRGLSGTIPARIGLIVIDAPDLASLEAFARDAAAVTRARRVRIRIGAWRAPLPGWTGRFGPVNGTFRADVRLPHVGTGRVQMRIELSSHRPIREVIAAAMDVLVPAGPLPFTQSASVGSNGGLPAWLPVAADVATHFVGSPLDPFEDGVPVDVVNGLKRNPDNPPPNRPAADAELVLEGSPAHGFGEAPTEAVGVTRHQVSAEGVGAARVLLDVHGRGGRRWTAPTVPATHARAHGRLQLRVTDGETRWRYTGPAKAADETASAGGRPWLGLDAQLRASDPPDPFAWWSLAPAIADGVASADAAQLILRTALVGVVVDGRSLPDAVRAHLSDELAGILAEPLPAATDNAMAWETRSVRQRRAVVRGHATSLVAHSLVRPGAGVEVAPPTVTALLITRRPRLAALALRMLRDQTYPRLEIIVGLHGVSPVAELEQEVALTSTPVEILELPGDTTLGEAIGIATDRARGSFVAKVDDDDIYGPEHIWDLIVARALSGATVVGKSSEFVMLDQLGILIRRSNMPSDTYDRVVAGGTMMLPRGELEALGGWRPVRSGLDRALLDRVIHGGGLIYRTWPIGFIYRRHGIGHTWDTSDDYFLRGAEARWEGIPDLPEFGTRHVRAVAGALDDLFQ